ncbi:hypothetical protein BDF19DRAFT_291977 [Syncephalis fuscata]|nr:hypothetical protein BDF19DRAFT_291977 [Syncephalis fuscata]
MMLPPSPLVEPSMLLQYNTMDHQVVYGNTSTGHMITEQPGVLSMSINEGLNVNRTRNLTVHQRSAAPSPTSSMGGSPLLPQPIHLISMSRYLQ